MTQSTILKHPFTVLKCVNQTPVVYMLAVPYYYLKRSHFVLLKMFSLWPE